MRQQETIEWVPVSEGLPENPGWYLVTVAGNDCSYEAWMWCDRSWENDGRDITQDVIAWANLPRGYRPEEG